MQWIYTSLWVVAALTVAMVVGLRWNHKRLRKNKHNAFPEAMGNALPYQPIATTKPKGHPLLIRLPKFGV